MTPDTIRLIVRLVCLVLIVWNSIACGIAIMRTPEGPAFRRAAMIRFALVVVLGAVMLIWG